MKISHYKLSVLLSIILLSLATFFYIYTTIFTQHGAYANSSAVINGIGGGNITGDCQAGKKALPIYCVQTDKKQISISFDAAWGADDTVQILDGSGGGFAGHTKQTGELLVQLDAGLYAYLDHAEKQHGHKGEGEREQPALPEEITEVQVIKKAADSIAEFASAKGSALLFWRKRCIGSRQLKLFHKEEHSFQVR